MEPFQEQLQSDQNPVSEPVVGFPGAATSSPKKKSKMWIIVLVLFVVAIGVITFIVFNGSKQSGDDTENLSPSSLPIVDEVPTPEATATPEAVSKESLKLQVLNGTGVAGEAAFLQTKLKNLGYTSIETGNAPSTVTTTSVSFEASVSQEVITEITALLKQTYTSVETGSTPPTDFDIQITVGSRKGGAATPAATSSSTSSPTPTPTAQ